MKRKIFQSDGCSPPVAVARLLFTEVTVGVTRIDSSSWGCEDHRSWKYGMDRSQISRGKFSLLINTVGL